MLPFLHVAGLDLLAVANYPGLKGLPGFILAPFEVLQGLAHVFEVLFGVSRHLTGELQAKSLNQPELFSTLSR